MSLYTTKNTDGSIGIDSKKSFCAALNNSFPPANKDFEEIFSDARKLIESEYPDVKTGALNNVRGTWYEWLLSLASINYVINNKPKNIFTILPNVIGFDSASLYEKSLFDLITDLRNKTSSAGVSLITSNPDFVIINGAYRSSLYNSVLTSITPNLLAQIESDHQSYTGKCDFTDIAGYTAAKLSLRPDRRLQISHEGSLVKALYTHLCTRLWLIDPPGVKYHAVSMAISKADRAGLKTVATHSITTASSLPEPAVDELYVVGSISEANGFFDKVLQ